MDHDKFMERMDLDRTLPFHLKSILKYLKERSNFSFASDKDTINRTIDFIYAYWKRTVAEKEESKQNDLTEWFNELTHDYSIRDIDSGYYDENTEDILYRVEGTRMIAPFGKNVLVLAKVICQKCRRSFFAILTFSFYSHYLEDPVSYHGYSSPLVEFPLDTMGYFQASRAFVELQRDKFLATSHGIGQSLLQTFKTKTQLTRLVRSGLYSQVFLAREFPINLDREFTERYWNLFHNRGSEKPPHTEFEIFERFET